MISQLDYDVFNAEYDLWNIRCRLWLDGIRLYPLNEIPTFPSMPQTEAKNMIDKLDKWIVKQLNKKHSLSPEENELLNKSPSRFDTLHVPIMDNDFPYPPELPPLPILITQTAINRKIKNAIENEREACAIDCECIELRTGQYTGYYFAKLIRERSDD